ncbi:MAG: DUF1800 family protein [Verrucomicrobiota bacterium]|nr:DUF1800 family protein [Verrucomicrobiota bacterium]
MPPARGDIDTNLTKQVWKLVNGLTDAQVNDPLWLAQDDDRDGVSNGAELAAGTNPLRADSTIMIKNVSADATQVYLSFPSVRGKLYSVESSPRADDPNAWTGFQRGAQLTGTGSTLTIAAPRIANAYYRIVFQDLDTDGDGVCDWAEIVAGLDPNNTHTKGAPNDDHTTLANDLVNANIVTMTATDPATTQPPDAATTPDAIGSITVTRGGTLNFSSITVPLAKSGTAVEGVDYAALPTFVTFPAKVGSVKVPVVPLANASRLSNGIVTLQVLNGGGYTVGSPASASVVIYPAGVARGTGLSGYYYNNTSATIGAGYSSNLFLPANLKATRTDLTVDFNFSTAGVLPAGVNTTYFTVRWAGQVQPQYSETYYFVTRTDDGVKLWVNGQLIVDKWVNQGVTDWTGAIDLKAGVLYDIKMEYFQATSSREAHLSWYSNSQVKQIVPSARLYPATGTAAPPSLTSALKTVGFIARPFSFALSASNSANAPTTFALDGNSAALPPGLSLNASTGVISGTPTQAGDYQVAITATNANGVGSSVLRIVILNTGNAVTREVWTTGVTGSAISDIPLNSPPSSIDNSLVTLEDNGDYADSTAERLRGYFTAPATGNYYFWLSASNAAELWISNNAEPVNKTRRAFVSAPGTGAEVWNAQSSQKSAWLSLVQGQRYYFEVLHNKGFGTSPDNVAVAYFQDPSGATANPVANNTGVVPGYVLSPYDYPSANVTSGTLYATNMAPQGTAATKGVGSANLRLNAAKTQAVLHFTYTGLSSPRTAYHIHMEAFGNNPSQIIYDIDDVDRFHPELKTTDGGYIWNIADVGTVTAADIVNLIQTGKTYINIHTVNFGPGEIRGNFGLVQGSQTPPVPQPDPGYNASDYTTDAGAARFLNQASFGATLADIAVVKSYGFDGWFDRELGEPATHLLPEVLANASTDPNNPYPATVVFNAWWRKSVTAPDQLRQRVAFALSEILVASNTGTLNDNGRALASYYDTLLDNAFGNFRNILKQVTLTPAMGLYLDMRGNQQGSLITGLHPNENYAREIMQLFSLGLNRLWPDGTLVLDSQGNLVPTYTQTEIEGMARVFTGWNYNQPLQGGGRLPTGFSPAANYIDPMVLVPSRHELGTKVVLDNVVLRAAQGYSLTSSPPAGSEANADNPAFDTYCLNDLEQALDSIFYNSSVPPFICRQLIQRLVSSNPSPGYVQRVVQKFEDDGSPQHVRGDMRAVIRAILLDGEARSTSLPAAIANVGGKQREPLLRITGPARAFLATGATGSYAQSGTTVMNITTTTPHRLSANQAVALDFTGNTPIAYINPTSQNYTVLSSPAPTATTFSVTMTGGTNVTFNQPANSNTVTLNNAGPAVIGAKVFLDFPNTGPPSGVYTVDSIPLAGQFTITTTEDPATVLSPRIGNALMPRVTAGYTIKNAGTPATSTITVATFANHNLQVNDHVWFDFATSSGALNTDAEFAVSSIVDERHFTIVVPNSTMKAEQLNTSTIYLLVPPPYNRSGSVAINQSKFDVNASDSDLGQTALNSPTVFNFFFPDYKYPGGLAANSVTTPEFQLTTDTNVVTLTNSIASSVLSSGNTNGLTSYRSGGNSITMDLSPYMTSAQVSNPAIPALIDKLGDLLTGGQLTASTKTTISNFVINNIALSAPPTNTQMRDRVRAVVHLIITSPEYAIQR